ncbi:MAG: NACHT domain-containing protein [Nostocaceae cyanobacterium]|nr:NACHT domain-containing protein [Nostocaceae cyanobacterium]
MPRRTYGYQIQARVKRLFNGLLCFGDGEFDLEELKVTIQVKWEGKDTHNPKLIVSTTLVDLEKLTAQNPSGEKLSKAQIREALYLLRDFVQILEDNRTKTQGAEIWDFSLRLWSKDKDKNLQQFDLAWEESRPEKSKELERTIKLSPLSYEDSQNWHDICQQMLEPRKRLTTNQMFAAYDDMKFELGDIYLQRALVRCNGPNKRWGDVLAKEGSQLYTPTTDEGNQRYSYEDFLTQVVQPGTGNSKGRRIALIAEPGAGKTTLAQAIALWILDNNLGLPIWISLADLPKKDGHLNRLAEYLFTDWLLKAIPQPRVTDAIATDFSNLFDSGRVWLFLDGVDELRFGVEGGRPSSQQGESAGSNFVALHWLASQLQGWLGKAQVVLTCRVNIWEGNINPLEEFQTYRLLGLDYPQQVHEFIQRWFSRERLSFCASFSGKSNRELVPSSSEQLYHQLDKPGNQCLQDLVKNPLRLALLCSIWQCGENRLVDTNARLYEQLVRAFYIWNQTRLTTTSQQQQQLNAALGRLAKRAMEQEKSRFVLQHQLVCQELGDSQQQNSLFHLALELGWINQVGLAGKSLFSERVYAFFHPVFQEYFATIDTEPRRHTDRDRWRRSAGYEPDRGGD